MMIYDLDADEKALGKVLSVDEGQRVVEVHRYGTYSPSLKSKATFQPVYVDNQDDKWYTPRPPDGPVEDSSLCSITLRCPKSVHLIFILREIVCPQECLARAGSSRRLTNLIRWNIKVANYQ